MQNYLFFMGQYEVVQGPVLHTSSSCTVILAYDHVCPVSTDTFLSPTAAKDKTSIQSVVLKFMRHRDEFEREILSRVGTDGKYVVPVIASYSKDTHPLPACVSISDRYTIDSDRMGFGIYPYLLVLPACTFSLADMILHGHIGSGDREGIRSVMRDLALAVGDLHRLGRIHGDVKPLNILRRLQ